MAKIDQRLRSLLSVMNTQTVIVLVLISSCQTNGSVRLKHLHKRTFHTTTQTCVYLTFNYLIQEHFIEVYRICSISTSYHDKTEFWLAEYIFRERTLIELFLHLLLLTLSPKILTNFFVYEKTSTVIREKYANAMYAACDPTRSKNVLLYYLHNQQADRLICIYLFF